MAGHKINCLIDSDSLLGSLDLRLLVEAIRQGHTETAIDVDRCALAEPVKSGETNHFIVLPAWRSGVAFGAKLVSIFPENERLGKGPNIHSVYALFDGTNGGLLCIITGDDFTRYKTAADSALGADILARHDSAVLTVIGAGSQAEAQIRLMCAVRPSISQVHIWNRTASKARDLTERLILPGVSISAPDDLEAAVRGAQIVTCITSSTSPVLRGEWLQPGTHVDLVGSFTPQMRESDDETMRRGQLFVDGRNLTKASGDIAIPIANGTITESAILGDLYDLCSNRVRGRATHEQVTIFKNAGGGHLDLMVAQALYQHATKDLPF